MIAANGVWLSRLVERLAAAGLLVERPAADVQLSAISDDSRSVSPGALFCAWAGTASDSHRFVAAAESAGATAALVERPVPESGVLQVVVRDGRRAAAVAALAFHGDPHARMTLVGVTGTNGKTTTVGLLRHVLEERGAAASIGTIGIVQPDGTTMPGTEALTTPGPVELARVLRTLADRGARSLAMEVSSHALHQGRVAALRYDAAVFTNLTRDHLDYHGSEQAYFAAKAGLLELLREDGVAVLNADEPAWRPLAGRAPRTVWYAAESDDVPPGETVVAEDVELGADGARFELVSAEERAPVRLPLLGAFNVQNALAAAAACIALGMQPAAVAARLATVPQVPGRLERIAEWPCPVLTDYAHTPDALERVLATLRPLTPGRLIVVFGAGGDRDRGKRPLMGGVAARFADVPVVTSDNPRTEDPNAIIDEIVKGMNGARHVRVTDRREAISRALDMARPEDVVLLAGKGHETYQIVGEEKVDFDERGIVQDWLAARGRA